MDAVRERWTDERLDDLNEKVDELGRRMEAGFAEQRREMHAQREETNRRFDAIDGRLEAMQRTAIQFGAAFFAAFAGVMATQLALILTQL